MKRSVGVLLGLGVLAALVGSGACVCAPTNNSPPEPATCTDPAPDGLVTALDLGNGLGSSFFPGTSLDRTSGGQGLAMVSFRIGVRSSAPVTCISAPTQVDGRAVALRLAVEPDSSGQWYVTSPLYTIGSGPLHVVTTAYGFTVERDMGGGGAVDAALPDAP